MNADNGQPAAAKPPATATDAKENDSTDGVARELAPGATPSVETPSLESLPRVTATRTPFDVEETRPLPPLPDNFRDGWPRDREGKRPESSEADALRSALVNGALAGFFSNFVLAFVALALQRVGVPYAGPALVMITLGGGLLAWALGDWPPRVQTWGAAFLTGLAVGFALLWLVVRPLLPSSQIDVRAVPSESAPAPQAPTGATGNPDS
jgi:hypothetical protein